MFRALTCPSSGGKIVFTQHLLSSLSVNVCTVHWLRAENCALKLVDEIILYYDARSKKHQIDVSYLCIIFINYYYMYFIVKTHSVLHRGADKSLARPTSRCILFYG